MDSSAELLRAIAADNAQATALLLFRGAGSAFVGASVMPSKIAKALGHEDLASSLAERTPTYASKISTIGFTSPGFIKRYAASLV